MAATCDSSVWPCRHAGARLADRLEECFCEASGYHGGACGCSAKYVQGRNQRVSTCHQHVLVVFASRRETQGVSSSAARSSVSERLLQWSADARVLKDEQRDLWSAP